MALYIWYNVTNDIRWSATVNEIPRELEIEGYLLQIKKVGNSLGLILPKELLARLSLKEGDKLYVVEQTERGIKLSPYDPKHAKAMEIARRSFRKYADTYKALAE
jgi:putative addiction module antidote